MVLWDRGLIIIGRGRVYQRSTLAGSTPDFRCGQVGPGVLAGEARRQDGRGGLDGLDGRGGLDGQSGQHGREWTEWTLRRPPVS